MPTSPAIRAIEHQMGFDHATNPPSLFDIITPAQLNDPAFMKDFFLTTLVTEDVINELREEHGMEIQEEPEGKATATPRPIPGVTITPTDPPQTFQSLATEVRERI